MRAGALAALVARRRAPWWPSALAACSSPSSTHLDHRGPARRRGARRRRRPPRPSVPAGSACAARDLTTTLVGSQGAAGTFELTFALRNTSTVPCPMDGLSRRPARRRVGDQLPTHVVSGGSLQFTDFAPAAVTLGAGATAYFNLAYSDVPTGDRDDVPDGDADRGDAARTPWTTTSVPVHITVCDGGHPDRVARVQLARRRRPRPPHRPRAPDAAVAAGRRRAAERCARRQGER